MDGKHISGLKKLVFLLHCLVCDRTVKIFFTVFPLKKNKDCNVFFNSLNALSYYGNDIITECDMWALSLGRNIIIILMSSSVYIMQLNENRSNNHEQQTEKLKLMYYYSTPARHN